MSTINRKAIRARVHTRIRKKLAGTPERPRLAVNFSNQHVYAQVIDDTKGVTLCAACTKNVEMKKASKESAAKVGELIAKKALEEALPGIYCEILPLSPAFITQGGPGCVAVQYIHE